MHIKVPMTAELYTKLIEDAGRHLRSTDLHIIYLLREAMGLEFPLTKEWPARAANSAGRGAPSERERVNDDAQDSNRVIILFTSVRTEADRIGSS